MGFVSIQNAHSIPCDGYVPATVRTGYETLVADRTSEMFAFNAKQDGKVIEVTTDSVVVEYTDGTRQGFKLGIEYGAASGLTLPHHITTFLVPNQKFKVGDTIIYNDGFFERDWCNPTRVVTKSYALAFVAMPEFEGTIEDSSVISDTLAKKLTTAITQVKSFVVGFDQHVSNLVSIGTHVKYDTVLFYLQDAVVAGNSLFDDTTIDQLKALGSFSPKAKVEGLVEDIVIYYHGELEDMSEPLRKLATQSDSKIKLKARKTLSPQYSGQVDEGYRIKGESLGLDQLEIKIFITTTIQSNIGDKAVFSNQLKTTHAGRYKDGEYRIKDGTHVDAVFGAKSGEDRIVQSLYLIGTTNTLLHLLEQKCLSIWNN